VKTLVNKTLKFPYNKVGMVGILGGGEAYYQKIKRIFDNNLIGYWPLWESSGSSAQDISGNFRNGVYSNSGVTYGTSGIGDGQNAISLDGVAGFVNLYSTSLSSAFSAPIGTWWLWLKLSSDILVNGVSSEILMFRSDGNNRTYLQKDASNNSITLTYTAGGVIKGKTLSYSSTAYNLICLSWNKTNDRLRPYIGNTQQGADISSLGTWSGVLNSARTLIGGDSTVPSLLTSMTVCHCGILNKEISQAEIDMLVDNFPK